MPGKARPIVHQWIYLIGGDFDAVKIGYTTNPPGCRVTELQVGNQFELRLLASCKGDRGYEDSLHRRFRADHLRGEWFRRTDRMNELIEFLSSGGDLGVWFKSDSEKSRRQSP